ncbi:NAD-dependent epimerase/dehydratase family protein [Streptomyces sp. TS71-3]|uniref:NAD-dependent epimerase/dehydratase family protein n=1 Tax=Streptomyces sp. TS71-3 TaxID=2733862 RepID=UPI001B21ABE3|nr:NAD-dependent epimerase/dehydratase family protein [Streptomyces sp. TS71-3]GHJ34565.1 NAD-dependent epimerase [Streptomyces sp. TS71-3]
MKVFVTGGSGYIGKAVISSLFGHGHTVRALARSEQAAQAVQALGAEPVRGGLTDLDVLNEAAAHAEAVIHLAQAETGEEDLAAATAMQDGIGAGTYVHTGGTWVYGDTDGVVDEDAPWNPPALVAWRHPVEDAVLGRAARGGRPVVIRAGLVYGGGKGLIDVFFTRPGVEAGAVAHIGGGSQHWALVHVDDLAELYTAALHARAGSVYAGVGGVNPTAKEVAEAVSHGAGLEGRTRSLTMEQAREQMGPVADAFALDQQLTPARAGAELGWVPAHTDPLSVFAQG